MGIRTKKLEPFAMKFWSMSSTLTNLKINLQARSSLSSSIACSSYIPLNATIDNQINLGEEKC